MTWLVWAVAAAASVQLAPSPAYVALVIAIAALVVESHRLDTTLARAFPLLLGLGVGFAVLRVILTVLTTHGGTDTIVTLPEATLPTALGGFTVGGTIEAAVLWQAAAEGLAVVGVLAVFGAFNAVSSHHELLQAAPRAFHEPGLVITVALAFVPSTLAAVTAVREADRCRTGGRVVRRGRLVRLAVPILESGMERAVGLAESMDARGFGRGTPARAEQTAGWLGAASLVALAGALVALVGRAEVLAAVMAGAGAATLVAAVAVASRVARPSRYRVRALTSIDRLVMAVAVAAPIGLGLLGALGDESLRWSAVTPLAWPRFNLLPAACILLLAVPALVRRGR